MMFCAAGTYKYSALSGIFNIEAPAACPSLPCLAKLRHDFGIYLQQMLKTWVFNIALNFSKTSILNLKNCWFLWKAQIMLKTLWKVGWKVENFGGKVAKNAIRLSLIFSFLSWYMSLLFALVLYIAIGEVAKLALVKNTRKISYEFFSFRHKTA